MRGHYETMEIVAQVTELPMVFGKECSDISLISCIFKTDAFVYVLIKGKKPVYVGQSVWAWDRIYTHFHSTASPCHGKFNLFMLIPCKDKTSRVSLEAKIIGALNPPLNKVHRTDLPKRTRQSILNNQTQP